MEFTEKRETVTQQTEASYNLSNHHSTECLKQGQPHEAEPNQNYHNYDLYLLTNQHLYSPL